MDTPTPDEDLTIAATLDPKHANLLRELHFEDAGLIRDAIKRDTFDGFRIVYAITNPAQTKIVCFGELRQVWNLRSRLKAYLKDREKIGRVELDSFVYVHVVVTDLLVLSYLQDDAGKIPARNKRRVQEHV